MNEEQKLKFVKGDENQTERIGNLVTGMVFRTFLMTILDKLNLMEEFEINLKYNKTQVINTIKEQLTQVLSDNPELETIINTNIDEYERAFSVYEKVIEDTKKLMEKQNDNV